jgi:hypothetical protein
MVSLFHQNAAFEDDDAVGHANGGESMGDEQSHFALGQFSKALKDLQFTFGIERGGGFIEDEQLRIAKIGAGESELLPFTARQIYAGFKAAAEHLVVASMQPRDDSRGEAFLSSMFDFHVCMRDFNSADCDILSRCHFVAHEVLKDDTDLRVEIGQIVFTEVNAIEQNLTFGLGS